MDTEQTQNVGLCDCPSYGLDSTEVKDGLLCCTDCGRAIQCEYDLENPHPATHWFEDYDVVCDTHEAAAV